MDEKTYVWQDYHQQYQNCLASLKLAKEIVTKDFIEQTQPPKIILKLRKKWTAFFSKAEFFRVCHNCQEVCCLEPAYFPISPLELLYFVTQKPDFEFPQPDWSFIKGRITNSIRYPCLFLSEDGCLLKENKPGDCIFYACKPLKLKAETLGLDIDSRIADRKQIEEEEYPAWCQRIIDYFYLEKISEGELIYRIINQNPGPAALKTIKEEAGY